MKYVMADTGFGRTITTQSIPCSSCGRGGADIFKYKGLCFCGACLFNRLIADGTVERITEDMFEYDDEEMADWELFYALIGDGIIGKVNN